MNRIYSIILTSFLAFICCTLVQSQNPRNLIGKIYTDRATLKELSNSIKLAEKLGSDGFVCRLYIDTLTNLHLVIVEKETKQGSIVSFEILEVLIFRIKSQDNFFVIGTDEKKAARNKETFVFAIECCLKENENYTTESKNIIAAFTFNKSLGKFIELNKKKLHRINDGYYY